MSKQNIEVKAYDNFKPLIKFWQQLKKDKVKIHKSVLNYYPISKEDFYNIQKSILNETNYLKVATMFYVLNRCSYSGSTLSGGMSPNHPRFNKSNIDRLLNVDLDNINFECMDFRGSIVKHKNNFKYLDPPYFIESSLYGVKGDSHKNFNHQELHNILSKVSNWALSYNDCEYIRSLYKNYKIVELDWSYGMSKNKKSNEILILNY